ncbi:MAG: hypothetical protein AAGC71_01790 [Pseudomonadota bacterium]
MASDWITEEDVDGARRFTVKQDVFVHVKTLLWFVGIFIGLVVVIALLPDSNSAGVATIIIALFLLVIVIAAFKTLIKVIMYGLFVGKATVSFSVSEAGLTIHRAAGRSRKHDGKTMRLDSIDGPSASFASAAAAAEAFVYVNHTGERIILATMLTNDKASYLHQKLCAAMGREVVHNATV